MENYLKEKYIDYGFGDVEEVVGKTVKSITDMEAGSEEIKITFTDGSEYKILPACGGSMEESETFEDIIGNPNDLIGNTITHLHIYNCGNYISEIEISAKSVKISAEAGYFEDPYGGPVSLIRTKPPTEPIKIGTVELSASVIAAMGSNEKFSQEVKICIFRHSHMDWGDVGSSGESYNDRAVRTGEHNIFSVYETSQGEIYIRTNEDRSVTVVDFYL